MNVLITGANGFIGSQISAQVILNQHQVTLCVRDVKTTQRRFPQANVIFMDFNQATDITDWNKALKGIDIVINCVGILESRFKKSIVNVQTKAPKALFKACMQKKIKRVIHVSAVGADEKAETYFARTKKAAEDYLVSLPIDWVIVKPSFVYGSGAYGGSALLRGLAGLPGIIPLVGDGGQLFMPVHIEDVAKCVANLVTFPQAINSRIHLVGPQHLSLKEILIKTRRWLGFKPAYLIEVPLPIIKVMAYIGRFFSKGPINPTSVKMLTYGNTAEPSDYLKMLDCKPRSFDMGLVSNPSQTQDRWHARLYFLVPFLRFVLALFWIFSGLIPILFKGSLTDITPLLQNTLPESMASLITTTTPLLNIALGILTLLNIRLRQVLLAQIFVIFIYTLSLTWLEPQLWFDPFGPLLKNLPILVLTLIMIAVSKVR